MPHGATQPGRRRVLTFKAFGYACLIAILLAMAAAPSAHSAPPPPEPGDEYWDDRFVPTGVGCFSINDSCYEDVKRTVVTPDGALYALSDIFPSFLLEWTGSRWVAVGEFEGDARDMAVWGDAVYVAGDFDRINGLPIKDIAVWDGSAWAQVGDGAGPEGGPIPSFTAVEALGSGLYLGGAFSSVDGVAANSVARWDGSTWSALGQGIRKEYFGSEEIADVLTLKAAGSSLYAGGMFDLAGSGQAKSIAVWNGATWSPLGGGVSDTTYSPGELGKVHAIAVDGANVYAGGVFDKAGVLNASNVARWNGSAWNNMGGGVSRSFGAVVYALRVQNGAVYVGGDFTSAGGANMAALARWTGTRWEEIGAALGEFDQVLSLESNPGGGMLIGGRFEKIGGLLANNIAVYDGGWAVFGHGLSWSDSYSGTSGLIYAMTADAAGRIYVGGVFGTAGGKKAGNIAMWDGQAWQTLGTGVDGAVRALLAVGNDVYAGGEFAKAGPGSAAHIAKWNSVAKSWSPLGSGVNGAVYALAYDAGALYVGGDFNTAGNVSAYDVAYWEQGTWHDLGDKARIYEVFSNCNEAGTQVYALAASDGYLYIGGKFRLVLVDAAQPCLPSSYRLANNVIVWEKATEDWYLTGQLASPGVTGGKGLFTVVYALALLGNDLYAGGDFSTAGGTAASNLARLSLGENRWYAVGSGVGGNDVGGTLSGSEVRALIAAGNKLFIGGAFSSAGDTSARFVASYTPATNQWSGFGSGVRDNEFNLKLTYVYGMAVTPTWLYVGGGFNYAGGKVSTGFARYEHTPPLPPPTCPPCVYTPLIVR